MYLSTTWICVLGIFIYSIYYILDCIIKTEIKYGLGINKHSLWHECLLTSCVTSHYIFQCAKLKYDSNKRDKTSWESPSASFTRLGSFSIFPLFHFLFFMLVSIIFGQNLHSLSLCGDFHISTDKPALDIDKGLPLCKGKKPKARQS